MFNNGITINVFVKQTPHKISRNKINIYVKSQSEQNVNKSVT